VTFGLPNFPWESDGQKSPSVFAFGLELSRLHTRRFVFSGVGFFGPIRTSHPCG